MTSEKTISVEGHEGLQFDGKMFHFDADEDVNILSNLVSKCCHKSLYSSVILSRPGHNSKNSVP